MKTKLLDQLDRLLEDYLTLLDSYQTVQASLQSNLKQGYFNLAKSKLALGPDRLSQKNWDLKQKESLVEVSVGFTSLCLSLARAHYATLSLDW